MPQRLNPQEAGSLLFQGAASPIRIDLSGGRQQANRYDLSGVAGALDEVFGQDFERRRKEKEASAEALGAEFLNLQDQIRNGADVGGRMAALTARMKAHPVAQAPFQRGIAKAKLERGLDELTTKLNIAQQRVPVTDENGAPLPFDQVAAIWAQQAAEVEAGVSYLGDLSADPQVGEAATMAVARQRAAFAVEVQKRAAAAHVTWVTQALGNRVLKTLGDVQGPLTPDEQADVSSRLTDALRDARNDNVPEAAGVMIDAGLAAIRKQMTTKGGASAALQMIEVLEGLEVDSTPLAETAGVAETLAALREQAQDVNAAEGERELRDVETYRARVRVEMANFLATEENADALLAGRDLREAAAQALAERGLDDPDYAGLVDGAYRELASGQIERGRPANPERQRQFDRMLDDPNAGIVQLMAAGSDDELGPERAAMRREAVRDRQDWQRVVQVGKPLIDHELGAQDALRAAIQDLGPEASIEAQQRVAALEREMFDALSTYARETVIRSGLGAAGEFDLVRRFAREQGAAFRQRLTGTLQELRQNVQGTRDEVRALAAQGKYGEARDALRQREATMDPGVFAGLSTFLVRAEGAEVDLAQQLDVNAAGSLADTVTQEAIAAATLLYPPADPTQEDPRIAAFQGALSTKLSEITADPNRVRSLIDPLSGTANLASARQMLQAATQAAGAEVFGDDWGAVQQWQAHSAALLPWAESVRQAEVPAVAYFRQVPLRADVARLVSERFSGEFADVGFSNIAHKAADLRRVGVDDATLFDVMAPFALTPDAVMRGALEVEPVSSSGRLGPTTAQPVVSVPLPATVDLHTMSLGPPETVRRWYARQSPEAQRAFMERIEGMSGIATFETLMQVQEAVGLHVLRESQNMAGVRIR